MPRLPHTARSRATTRSTAGVLINYRHYVFLAMRHAIRHTRSVINLTRYATRMSKGVPSNSSPRRALGNHLPVITSSTSQ